jgi:hypothetical protein
VTDPETGLTYSCSVTGPTSVPGSAVNCGATTIVDLSGAGRDGLYTLSVTATDAAGNTSSAGSATYLLDTTPPPAPVVVVPAPMTKTPVFGISDGDPTATLTCLLTSPKGRTVFPATPPGVCPSTGGFDTSGFADGTYTLTVTATDPAGNVTVTVVTWLRDTTPPPVPTVVLSLPVSSPGNVTDPHFSVSDTEAGVSFACSVSGPTSVPASAVSCGPTTTVDLSGAGRDGSYTLSVTATDAAGNTSVAGSATYVLDTTAPPVPTVTLSAPASSPGNLTHPQFTVTDPETGLTYSCSVTGPTSVPGSAVNCGPTTIVDLSGAGRDGLYTLSVTATDAAGNTSSAGSTTYLLDTSAPPAPVVTLMNPTTSPSYVAAPQFSVSDTEAGVGFSCSASGPTPVPASAISCGATTTVDLSGTGRDGSYTVSVTATDAAGNTSGAGTALYVLDTTAPLPPVVGLASATRSNSKTPWWTWQFAFTDTATNLDTASCTITGPHSWTSTTVPCPHHFSAQLGGGDGVYQLTVTLTDEAGNSASASSPQQYTLDSTAPAGPTVFMLSPASGVGLSHHPVWSVTGPPNSTLLCTLRRGGQSGSAIVTEEICPDPATFSLAGLPDGLYTLEVVAVDIANNRSYPAWSTYALVPSPPIVGPPTSQNPTAVWSIHGDQGDTYVCTLLRDGRTIVGPASCDNAPSYDMSGRPAGQYTLSVVAVGAEGVRSTPGSATWTWDGTVPPPPLPPSPPGNAPHQHQHPASSGPGGLLSKLPSFVKKLYIPTVKAVKPSTVFHYFKDPQDVPDAVSQAVQGVVEKVGAAGGGTGFPLILLALLVGFLVVQNRIDRRDPKLALASIAADDTVEFEPPPSRRDRP